MINCSDEFSLFISARSLAASTVAYLEPQSRGLGFSAYDAIVREALRPPFSQVVLDAATFGNNETALVEEDVDKNHIELVAQEKEIPCHDDLQKRYNGNYEIKEIYDRAGKQTVRCLCAVVRGKYRMITTDDEPKYQPGSISITFRGTDTLENVVADVRFLTMPYDDGAAEWNGSNSDGKHPKESHDRLILGKHIQQKNVKNETSRQTTCRPTVHTGFRDAWYGDNLRSTTIKYISEQVDELNRENADAVSMGLEVLDLAPTIDITGHSLGGSLAILAAYDLTKILSSTPKKRAHIRVYTHGCPRVGNGAFVQNFNDIVSPCWNIINKNDIVPAIPHSPSMSRWQMLCSCLPGSRKLRSIGYKRHGRVVIVKSSGNLIIDPTRRQKYRREAKVLRIPMAIKSHETGAYRLHLRAAVQNQISITESPEKMRYLDGLLGRLDKVIVESRANPDRSFRILPGAT